MNCKSLEQIEEMMDLAGWKDVFKGSNIFEEKPSQQ